MQPFKLPPPEIITNLPKETKYIPPHKRKVLSPSSKTHNPYSPKNTTNLPPTENRVSSPRSPVRSPIYKAPPTQNREIRRSPVRSPLPPTQNREIRRSPVRSPLPPTQDKRSQKPSLPLIGTNYKYVPVPGVAYVINRPEYKNILTNDKTKPRVNEGTWFENEATQIKWYTRPEFRDNKNLLTYEIVDISYIYDNRNAIKRSSYIPYIVTNGERYWLLGSFHDFPQIKVDFGGKCNMKSRETGYDCATRETNEETSNVLTEYILPQIKNKNLITVYRGYNKNQYRSNYNEGSNVFIMIDMTNNIDVLDVINNKIDLAWSEKPDPKSEVFGPLGFYKEQDILNGSVLTSFALTDFVNKFR